MSGNKDKLIAFNYFGGKFTWLEYLYKYFPDKFTHLVDLFAGSMVVSLNYKGRVIKTANEINADITNFFEVLRNNELELIRLLPVPNWNTIIPGNHLQTRSSRPEDFMFASVSLFSDWVHNARTRDGIAQNNT